MLTQPARKSYYFEKGYKDLFNTIRGAWENNKTSANQYWLKYKNNDSSFFYSFLYIFATISVILVGTFVTALMSILHILLLFIFMSGIYLSFSIIWGFDRLYLIRKRIFSPCTVCTKSSEFLIPTYLCPNCGREHTRLVPGVYGILHRECDCGYILPSTFFNGRRELNAICPNPKCKAPFHGKESMPICIPVVGGSTVGKTIFITAFVKNFIDFIVPLYNWEIESYSPEKQQLIDRLYQNYMDGKVIKTIDRSAISLNFFLRSKKGLWSPEKLFFIYDIAGEIFGGETEERLQKQYLYCHGIVFIIDPFSSSDVKKDYESKISDIDMQQISQTNPIDALDNLIQRLHDIAGLSPSALSKVPIAVVINKTDIGGLGENFNKFALDKVIARDPNKKITRSEAQNIACKEFLRNYGMGNVVQTIEMRFKTNKFFDCSALGHTVGKGSMEPFNIMAPMRWLISSIDKDIAKSWGKS